MRITNIERWRVRVPMKPDTVNSLEYDAQDPGLAGFWEVPVALHLGNPVDVLNAVKREAVDFLNISPGSMAMFVKCCFITEQAGVPVWHGSGVDLGIMDMSYVHACAAAAAATLPSDIVGNFLREDDLLVDPIRIEDGYALIPNKGGLGVELDEEAVRKYQVTGPVAPEHAR